MSTSNGVVKNPEVAPAMEPLIEFTKPGSSYVASFRPLYAASILILVILRTSYNGNCIALKGISLKTNGPNPA